ncbi:hypothetical protein [Desulfococcus sp.]|uniref:hypothetical protein n=1 Tax=Desulfococcus sp. TaxID=2025834 RepID=UPI003593A978
MQQREPDEVRLGVTALERRLALTRYVLCPEVSPAPAERIARWFGPFRRPGTMAVGDRKTSPEIFQDTLDSRFETYDDWLDRVLGKTIADLTGGRRVSGRGAEADPADLREIVRMAGEVLEFETDCGVPLHGAIPQQLYEDAFVRLLSVLPGRPVPVRDTHPYAEFNALCHRLGLVLIEAMAGAGILGGPDADIPRAIQAAVLSGYVGINLKSSASAASDLLNRELMSIDPAWIGSMAAAGSVPVEALSGVARGLIDLASEDRGRFALDSLDDYHREVVDADVPTLLVFFCDDYLESLVDMKRFEAMLDRNPRLALLFIPRNGRYGNDLAIQDIPAILAEAPFARFSALEREGRIAVSRNGPCGGCIDPRTVSEALIDEMDALGAGRRIILETKGCRNFEMLQGRLPLPWYAAFNCNRALSIRTVQVDGPPVFLRIPPGLRAYDGFMTPRIGRSPSYGTTGVRFARMTTRQLYDVLSGEAYRRMLRRSGDEYGLNRRLADYCEKNRQTLPEGIEAFMKVHSEAGHEG